MKQEIKRVIVPLDAASETGTAIDTAARPSAGQTRTIQSRRGRRTRRRGDNLAVDRRAAGFEQGHEGI